MEASLSMKESAVWRFLHGMIRPPVSMYAAPNSLYKSMGESGVVVARMPDTGAGGPEFDTQLNHDDYSFVSLSKMSKTLNHACASSYPGAIGYQQQLGR